MHSSLDRRRAGLLLHISSLPGNGETGDLGAEAHHFINFLKAAGFSVWQMLPIGPTQNDGSPYQSSSMYAGNPRFIGLEPLITDQLLPPDAVAGETLSQERKEALLQQAWGRFQTLTADAPLKQAFQLFIEQQAGWLDDYSLFCLFHQRYRCGWWQWPEAIRERRPATLLQEKRYHREQLEYICFEQFLFFRQWEALKQYANGQGIQLFGDMPIFVAHDSAEVWSHQDMFWLDRQGELTVVAGVPPDYFSETGQRWGNPLYRWERMQADGFSFWVERMRHQLQLFDLVRIDHFRGFEAYWEIPASEEHAINGRWVEAPGVALFERLHEIYDPLPLVAEDLGIITPAVEALRLRFHLPGMKVLQFAFTGQADNPYLPFRHETNSVVYTGTHDNDTTLGWYLSLDDRLRLYVDEYLGRSKEVMPWPMIRTALASRSRLAIIPMQDVLGLNGEHRMNLPGTIEGNWSWRFNWSQVEEDLAWRLYQRVEMYDRLAC